MSRPLAAAEPRIAAVIPVFNRETTIGRAIESALAQTRPPAEVVVVDDGSTDGTAAVVTSYGDRVRYLVQRNAGAAAARNRGVAVTNAPWIAFLDSDDYWFDDHLARMADAITATRGIAGFYFADVRRPASQGATSWWALSGFAVPDDHELVDDATAWVLSDLQPTFLQASVFDRERYLALGGLWPALRIREDTHLFFALGIGRPACAVAGGGVQLTADDRSGQRLTEALGSTTVEWWRQSRLMYADVLARFPDLAAEYRLELRARLADADLQLAKVEWRRRRVVPATRHLARGLRVAPGDVVARAARRLGRTVAGRDRDGAPLDETEPSTRDMAG